jgi:vesicle coat complex subunit
MAAKEETSVIQIIQDMVREGESEQKIIQTLRDLGIEEDKAKRLLLLGQADTFALLQSEISKIVKSNLQQEIPKLSRAVTDEAKKTAELSKRQAMEEIKDKYSKLADLEKFEDDVSEKTKTSIQLSEKVRDKLNELGERVQQVSADMQEIQSKGIGTRNKAVSLGLVILGIIFCLATLYMFWTTFSARLTIDSIIVTVILAAIGITMLFVSTLI